MSSSSSEITPNKTPRDRVVPFAAPGVEIEGELLPMAASRAGGPGALTG